jgi:hypothetical protein
MFMRISFLFVAVFFFLMTGCTVEKKLAKTFVDSEKSGPFFLLRPSIVFKYNLKEFQVPGIDSLDEFTKDSLLLENSLFLKNVTDSVLIDEFIYGLKKSLETYGAVVYVENEVDTLLAKGGTPFIINVAQVSLEEYIHPYSSEEVIYDEVFLIDGIDLNAINYNFWLELGRMNTEKKNKVLFTSDYLLDQVNGTFKQNLMTGKLRYDFTIDTITISQVYKGARQFGKATAGYLFDYLMNSYIGEMLPEDYPFERIYFHYDPERRLIYSVEDEGRIEELDSY